MRSPLLPRRKGSASLTHPVLLDSVVRSVLDRIDRRRVDAVRLRQGGELVDLRLERVRKAHLVSERILRVLGVLGGGGRVRICGGGGRRRRGRGRVGAVALPFEGGVLALDPPEVNGGRVPRVLDGRPRVLTTARRWHGVRRGLGGRSRHRLPKLLLKALAPQVRADHRRRLLHERLGHRRDLARGLLGFELLDQGAEFISLDRVEYLAKVQQ